MNFSILTFPSMAFLLGSLIVVMMTPFLRQWAHSRAVLDVPTELRKIHTEPIPRVGGFAIYAAFLVIFLLLRFLFPEQVQSLEGWEEIFVVVTPMFIMGAWDDFRPLGAKKKLAAQIVIAIMAYWIGVRIENITNPFNNTFYHIGLWGLPLTVLWLVAITNLINLIDGLDGLAAGVSLFLMVVLAALAASRGSVPLLCLSVGIAGALAGFLFFNFPPAKIFLGDGGAYFLGSLIATMALVNSSKGEVVAAMVVPFFALGLPVLDTALAILRRGILGLPIFRGDRQHIHHRLLDMGFSQRRTVVLLYMICALLCLIAAFFFVVGSRWWALLLGVLFTVALMSVRGLGYVKGWDKFGLQLAGSAEKRRSIQMALLLGKVLVLESENCRDWPEFVKLASEKLEKLGFHSFKLRTRIAEIESAEWRPEHPRPWNIENAEWVEHVRLLQIGREVVGEIRLCSYVEEDWLDHYDRVADVLAESIEDAFQVCHRRFA